MNVGKITDIDLDGYRARVTLKLQDTVDLPANTTARIRQTSLLGEKFVALESPTEGATGRLADGDVIPVERTGRNPEVEEVLGALSLVLNGGGVAQLKTIASELNLALEGREDAAKSVLTQVDALMGTLDENKTDIVNAIESLNQLSVTAREQMDSIDAALEELPSALDSIDRQRQDLVRMLRALNELGDVGVRVIRESKDVTIETFRQLQPVLTQLANSGDDFVDAFHVFLTFPFVDEVVGRDPQVARNLHMGDYVNLSVNLDLDLERIPGVCFPLDALGQLDVLTDAVGLPPLRFLCQDAQDALQRCITNKTVKACSRLPDVLLETVCGVLNTLPLPLQGLCGRNGLLGGNGGKGGQGLDLGGLLDGLLGGTQGSGGAKGHQGKAGKNGGKKGGVLDGLLGGLGGLGALGRAPALQDPQAAEDNGRRMGELMTEHDPAMVSLLMSPMVVDR